MGTPPLQGTTVNAHRNFWGDGNVLKVEYMIVAQFQRFNKIVGSYSANG